MTTGEVIAAVSLFGGSLVAGTGAIIFFVRAGAWMGKLDEMRDRSKKLEEYYDVQKEHARDIVQLKHDQAELRKRFSGMFPRVLPPPKGKS